MDNKSYNTVTVFKHFISFLEVWRQENYGESAEINWQAVWSFVNASGVLDFNDELADLVHSKPEDAEGKIHQWIENRIVNGEPVHLLFTMSPWLMDKLEKERDSNIEKAERERFNKCKCYKCKFWSDDVSIWVEEMGRLQTYCPGECDEKLWECRPVQHHPECAKWKELYSKLAEGSSRWKHFHLEGDEFSYKPFNEVDRVGKFRPEPLKLADCPYFEDTGIGYEEYLEKHKELA